MKSTPGKMSDLLINNNIFSINFEKPFVYTDGTIGPGYNDIRLLVSFPELRKKILSYLSNMINLESIEFDVISGIETGSIAWAAFLAEYYKCPLVYVRKQTKCYGKLKQIEGKFDINSRVLIVEDVVRTGSSSIDAANCLVENGAKITACISILNCGFKSTSQLFEKLNIPFFYLTSYFDLINQALKKNLINKEEHNSFLDWINSPEKWNKNK